MNLLKTVRHQWGQLSETEGSTVDRFTKALSVSISRRTFGKGVLTAAAAALGANLLEPRPVAASNHCVCSLSESLDGVKCCWGPCGCGGSVIVNGACCAYGVCVAAQCTCPSCGPCGTFRVLVKIYPGGSYAWSCCPC